MTRPSDSYETKTLFFLLFITLFRLVYSTGLRAIPDEAYYYIWSRQLDWSYFCHPPMLAYAIAFFNRFVTNRELVLKLVTTLFMAFSSIYIFHLAKELFHRRLAFYCVVLSNISLLFMAGSFIATPDVPMIFFLTGASYHFYRAVQDGKTAQWLIAGVFTGFALLSKFIAFLIYPSFFLYLLLPENRKWFRRAIPYLTCVLSLLVFSPVVFWNSRHHWVSFGFQLHHGFGGNKGFPRWNKFFEYLGGQLGLVGPILFGIFFVALIATALSWKKRSLEEKFLWCLSSVPFVFFLLVSLQKKVEANWPCFAYVPGILLAMAFYESHVQPHRWGRMLWKVNWGLKIVVLGVLLVHIYLPFLPIPLRKDRTNDFFGWDQLGTEAVQLAEGHPGFELAVNRYQLASEMIMYSDLPLICLNIEGRPNQFDIWQDRSTFQGKNYLYFDDHNKPKEAIVSAFERFEYLKTIPLKRRNAVMKEIRVYKGYHYIRPEGELQKMIRE